MAQTDPFIAEAIAQEALELIASENLASRAMLDVQGSILTNKTVEGYPASVTTPAPRMSTWSSA